MGIMTSKPLTKIMFCLLGCKSGDVMFPSYKKSVGVVRGIQGMDEHR